MTGPDARKTTTMKNNYGRPGTEIAFDGTKALFGVDTGPDPAVGSLINKKADDLFLDPLCLFTAQCQHLSPSPGATYAPKIMAEHPRAKASRVRIVTKGPPSSSAFAAGSGGKWGGRLNFQRPFAFQPRPNGGVHTLPIPP
jgi:hypothetical protein